MTYIALLIVGILLIGGAIFVAPPPSPDMNGASGDAPRETRTLVDVPTVDSNHIDLSGRGLTSLPKDVLAQRTLRSLDISDNALSGALPAEIRLLSSLEVLDASGNRMTGVPAEIGQLSRLRILDLSDNELTGLPHELGNLRSLERLDLSGNTVSQTDLEIIRSALPATTQIIL